MSVHQDALQEVAADMEPARPAEEPAAPRSLSRDRSGAIIAYCPVDKWGFHPRYTEGVCPLCGWRPDDAAEAGILPARLARWAAKVDWSMVTFAILVAAAIAFGIWAIVVHGSADH
ncbi:MAG: hypothetical protein WDA71_13245 [Actinomycetota bacterium]